MGAHLAGAGPQGSLIWGPTISLLREDLHLCVAPLLVGHHSAGVHPDWTVSLPLLRVLMQLFLYTSSCGRPSARL